MLDLVYYFKISIIVGPVVSACSVIVRYPTAFVSTCAPQEALCSEREVVSLLAQLERSAATLS